MSAGRNKKIPDLDRVKSMIKYKFTKREIAKKLDISTNTLWLRLKEEYNTSISQLWVEIHGYDPRVNPLSKESITLLMTLNSFNTKRLVYRCNCKTLRLLKMAEVLDGLCITGTVLGL